MSYRVSEQDRQNIRASLALVRDRKKIGSVKVRRMLKSGEKALERYRHLTSWYGHSPAYVNKELAHAAKLASALDKTLGSLSGRSRAFLDYVYDSNNSPFVRQWLAT